MYPFFQPNAYLQRIRYQGSTAPTLETLTALQSHHLLAVPFENLDIHWGNRIRLDLEQIYEKVIRRGRGGFCYELNGMFYLLLSELGFEVKRVAARVRGEDDVWSPDYAHLTLVVSIGEQKYLVEVGFGRFSFHPLRVVVDQEQQDTQGRFKLVPFAPDLLAVQHWTGTHWQSEFAFREQETEYPAFQKMCDYFQDDPDSYFRSKKICTQLTPTGRITLSSTQLKLHEGTTVQDIPIRDEADFDAKLWQYFGIRR